ncbi:MAG: hypothetical protein ACRD0G_01585 [Acidimicrobiales bacterium]
MTDVLAAPVARAPRPWGGPLAVLVALLVPVVALVTYVQLTRDDPPARPDRDVDGGELRPGDAIDGSVEFSGSASYELVASGEVTIAVSGEGFDSTVRVFDGGGDEVAYNDDFEVCCDAQVTVEVAEGETYIVEVRELGGNAGTFRIEVAEGDESILDPDRGFDDVEVRPVPPPPGLPPPVPPTTAVAG